MKLVLSVNAIGEQAEGRCPWMWIDLSPPLARRRRWSGRWSGLTSSGPPREDEDVIELYCVSLEGTFFNPWLAAPEARQEEEGIAIEDLLEQLCADDRDSAVPDELSIPEWATVRIDESQMIVLKDGVAFVASPRGAAAFVGTGEVPMEVLERASEQPL
jgi:hypothetical protein